MNDYESKLSWLSEIFDGGDVDKITNAIESTDNIILANFLEATNSDNKEKFIKYHINESILIELSSDLKSDVLELIGVEKYVELILRLEVEDELLAIQDLDYDMQQEILDRLPESESKDILYELLAYPEESAGRLIQKDFIIVPQNWTMNQVVEFLRIRKNIPKHQTHIFVVDRDLKPVGRLELSDIIFTKKNTKVSDQMERDLHVVTTDLDQEEVANIFQQYDLLSTAVINEEGKIVGTISADEIVNVIKQEAEEDILHLGKVSTTDISTTFMNTIYRRLPWLFITFLAINLTSVTVGLFETTLVKSVELVILMPIIAAMGGNAGIQASTIAVRAIVTGKLTNVNTLRLMVKELFIGFANGIILSSCTVLIVALRFHSLRVEAIFALSMIIVFSFATFVGSAIPIVLHKAGADPALSSSIITSAITDMLSFSALLVVAKFLLPA